MRPQGHSIRRPTCCAWVADGNSNPYHRNHNPELCQLSYSHRESLFTTMLKPRVKVKAGHQVRGKESCEGI